MIISIIKVYKNNDIEKYYQVFDENCYYISENKNMKFTKAKTIDNLFSEVSYIYDA